MDNFIDQMAKIIRESAKSPLGISALAIAVLSLIGVLFFREASVEVKIAIYALMFAGFAGFVLLAFRRHGAGDTQHHKTEEIQPTEQSEKGGLRAKGDEKLEDAENLRLSWRNDQARSAYEEARTLYKQVGDRLGEANVLLGLGDLERTLGRNDQARAAYTEARMLFKQEQIRLGEANVLVGLGDLERKLGRNDQARAAYTEARTLFKQVEDRLGEADVLLGSGHLLADTDAELAKRHFHQAAYLYGAFGMPDWERTALDEAAKLSSP